MNTTTTTAPAKPAHTNWCRKCSEEFQFFGSWGSGPDYCPTCTPLVAAEQLQERRQLVLDAVASETPTRYRATDTSHPDFNAGLWDAVKAWRPTEEKPWLGLIGPSGACKTRIALMLMRDMALEQFDNSSEPVMHRRTSFEYVESYTASRAVSDQYSDDSQEKHDAKALLDRLSKMRGLLVLDDFGKAKNTPSYAAQVFAILDSRHAHNLPLIWTANNPPETIVQGMSEDLAGPLAGRLIECSRIVTIQ